MARIYQGNVGVKIILNAGENISNNTVLKIIYKKPNNFKGEWTANLEGTNFAYYITQEGDLDIVGIWQVQLYAELADWEGYGDIAKFEVFKPLT